MKRISLILLLAMGTASTARAQLTEEALLDTLQESAFKFFITEANPVNGLIRDRSQVGSPCSIASQGFGFSSICVGIDRGWITRADGAERVRKALNFFYGAPQGPDLGEVKSGYKGLFYHFLDINTGLRVWDSELSTIDTALLFAGIYDARQYFTGSDTTETAVRAYADSITRRADWDWMRNFNPGLMMGWKPNTGFGGFGQWVGYNEAMIMYIIALGSPTHPVPATVWTAWISESPPNPPGYVWATQYGLTYVLFPPLFGHQYSHCWIDFRGIADAYMRIKGIDYFENSRRATLAQKRYATANPLERVGYAANLWGLTASDTPTGYNARGAPPTQNDDGTITPTAALSSIPFAPDSTIPVAWKLWNDYRTGPLWGPYGFRDAFNLTVDPDWYDPDYIGIDEGPIVMMIENHRSGSIWQRFKHHPDIHRGLNRAGFLAVVGVEDGPVADDLSLAVQPTPFRGSTTVRFRLATATAVRLSAYDIAGREVARLMDGYAGPGEHAVLFVAHGLPSGVYHLRLSGAGRSWVKKCVLVR